MLYEVRVIKLIYSIYKYLVIAYHMLEGPSPPQSLPGCKSLAVRTLISSWLLPCVLAHLSALCK